MKRAEKVKFHIKLQKIKPAVHRRTLCRKKTSSWERRWKKRPFAFFFSCFQQIRSTLKHKQSSSLCHVTFPLLCCSDVRFMWHTRHQHTLVPTDKLYDSCILSTDRGRAGAEATLTRFSSSVRRSLHLLSTGGACDQFTSMVGAGRERSWPSNVRKKLHMLRCTGD